MKDQSKKKGFVAIHRSLQDHWLWKEKPFSRPQAWIDLIMTANHTPNKFTLGNQLIKVDRGEMITSEKKLMERWGWSKSKIRAFLKLLQEDQMIVKKADRKKTTLTICQYSVFQDWRTTKDTTKKPQKIPRSDTNNNEEINLNNEEEERLARNLIFCFKQAYKDRFAVEYTKATNLSTAYELFEKLKGAVNGKGNGFPWEWFKRYFAKMYSSYDGSPVLNDFHRNQLSIEHINKYFNEIHTIVFDLVGGITFRREEEKGNTVDAELRNMGMAPAPESKNDSPDAPPPVVPLRVDGGADGS